jgi:hypothetical protein
LSQVSDEQAIEQSVGVESHERNPFEFTGSEYELTIQCGRCRVAPDGGQLGWRYRQYFFHNESGCAFSVFHEQQSMVGCIARRGEAENDTEVERRDDPGSHADETADLGPGAGQAAERSGRKDLTDAVQWQGEPTVGTPKHHPLRSWWEVDSDFGLNGATRHPIPSSDETCCTLAVLSNQQGLRA